LKWYQSKYAKAFYVAFFTGLISALITYLGILDDLSLTTRQVVKIVGLAGVAPFATLVRFLPSFQDIFSGGQPVVNVDHAETVTQNNPPADAPPSRHPAPAHPPVRDARGQYAKAAPLNVVADH
jgi:hypothetical protein